MTSTIRQDPLPDAGAASPRGGKTDHEVSRHASEHKVEKTSADNPANESTTAFKDRSSDGKKQSDIPKHTDTATENGRAAAKHPRIDGFWNIVRWALVVTACLWLALCTSLGPLYRQFLVTDASQLNPNTATITSFGPTNVALFIVALTVYLCIVIALVRLGRCQTLLPRRRKTQGSKSEQTDFSLRRHRPGRPLTLSDKAHSAKPSKTAIRDTQDTSNGDVPCVTSDEADRTTVGGLSESGKASTGGDNEEPATGHARERRTIHRAYRKAARISRRMVLTCTSTWRRLALVLLIGWLWVPATLVCAFGADMRSQLREFSWAWNQVTGLKQPYIGFFAFVPMDIYPTAHYLWPSHPTYLTDQHNIVLTLLYGATGAVSRHLTGANDLGLVLLCLSQFLFAVFCMSTTANRFFNRPWMNTKAGQTEQSDTTAVSHETAGGSTSSDSIAATQIKGQGPSPRNNVGPWPRFLIMAFLLICPPVLFATISLTKSPLFAFAFAWWFGIGYELKEIGRDRLSRKSFAALIVSTCIMLISAKYAWYIIVVMTFVGILADHHRFMTYLIGLLLPAVVMHGGLALAISSGTIIGGDPIESHGVQLQQIARIAKLDPDSIPQSAKDELAPIFNLDQMAEAYSQQDADPVKSSGIQSKRVSYKWRTVTSADMKLFNKAWLEIVKANPRIALDALLAKCYGYFDIQDRPYIDMTYYVNSDYVRDLTVGIGNWIPGWRDWVTNHTKQLSGVAFVGWLIHGNTYVIATLLMGAAEVVLRRWRTLTTHLPLLLLMGVMITSPANNFERHMLPLIFVFGFVCLTFWLESHKRAGDAAAPSATASASVTMVEV